MSHARVLIAAVMTFFLLTLLQGCSDGPETEAKQNGASASEQSGNTVAGEPDAESIDPESLKPAVISAAVGSTG